MPIHDEFSAPVAAHLRPAELLDISLSVGETLEALSGRELAQGIVYFYVVDAAGVLRGIVPTRKLLGSQAGAALTEIMMRDVISVGSEATMREAAELMRRYHIMAVPVLDADGHMLGV